jgi:peptidoglycan/LPS O-acetylase OafA/YrhL
MEGIAFGAMLANGFRFRRPGILAASAATGISPLLLLGGPNGFEMTVVGVTLVAILFGGLLQIVIASSPEQSFGLRILRSEALINLGRCSYSIYLLHMVLLAVAVRLHESRGWPPVLLFIGGTAGSYLLGWLSWRAFESKVMLLKRYFQR